MITQFVFFKYIFIIRKIDFITGMVRKKKNKNQNNAQPDNNQNPKEESKEDDLVSISTAKT